MDIYRFGRCFIHIFLSSIAALVIVQEDVVKVTESESRRDHDVNVIKSDGLYFCFLCVHFNLECLVIIYHNEKLCDSMEGGIFISDIGLSCLMYCKSADAMLVVTNYIEINAISDRHVTCI